MQIEILLATFNGSGFLSSQIESILAQTNDDWVLIVHDDQSQDSTQQVINYYASEYPERVRVIDDRVRLGSAKANFSYLLNFSTASYIAFSDQDDIWLPEKLDLLLAEIVQLEKKYPKSPIIVHSDLHVVDSNNNLINQSLFDYQCLPKTLSTLDDLLTENSVTGCAMMFNRKALEVSLPFDNRAMMHDWWIAGKVIQHGGLIKYIDKPLVRYRQHSNNSVGAKRVSLEYYLRHLLSIHNVFSHFQRVHQQALLLNKNCTRIKFLKLIIKSVFKRFTRRQFIKNLC